MGKPEIFLLHICCAPCASGCLDMLYASNIRPVLYFSNSNLDSEAEFNRRLEAAQILADAENLELAVDPYDHASWLEKTQPLAAEPERGRRCRICFDWSLARASLYAETHGFTAFATSLTVSPHKPSELIFEIGSQYRLFQPWNFKKQDGFLKGNRRAKALGLYRQTYCGCEFSLRDRLAADAERTQRTSTIS